MKSIAVFDEPPPGVVVDTAGLMVLSPCPAVTRCYGLPVRSRSGYGWTIELASPVYVRGLFQVAFTRGSLYMVSHDAAVAAVREAEARALEACGSLWHDWFGVPGPEAILVSADYRSEASALQPVFESVIGAGGSSITCWAPRKVRGSTPNAPCDIGDTVDGELTVKRLAFGKFKIKLECELRVHSCANSTSLFRADQK